MSDNEEDRENPHFWRFKYVQAKKEGLEVKEKWQRKHAEAMREIISLKEQLDIATFYIDQMHAKVPKNE